MYSAVKTFARDNPTMILTLCYVLITAIGTGYSFFFYREFDINIIKFADLSDFLLAAILEPLSLVMFALILIFIAILYWTEAQFRKHFNWYQNFTEKRLQSKYTDPIVMIVIVFIGTVTLMQDLAIKNADGIKNEGKDNYQVRFYDNQSGETVKRLELLGSTSRFAYFYDQKNKMSVVISPENLNYISKPVTYKKPVEEDELMPQKTIQKTPKNAKNPNKQKT